MLFWATQVPVRFPVLIEAAQKGLVLFGSTWSCESGFSAMNHIKNNLRCRPLRDLLRLSISPLCPHSLDVLTYLALFRKCFRVLLVQYHMFSLAKQIIKAIFVHCVFTCLKVLARLNIALQILALVPKSLPLPVLEGLST